MGLGLPSPTRQHPDLRPGPAVPQPQTLPATWALGATSWSRAGDPLLGALSGGGARAQRGAHFLIWEGFQNENTQICLGETKE